jgi:chromosome partitioning protein
LACELARQALDKSLTVGIEDADPRQDAADWAKIEGKPKNIQIFENANEENIMDLIDEAKSKNAFVLVDLEGVRSNTVTYAISKADLVLVACQASKNDAKEAVNTLKTIRNSGRMIGRDIPSAVIFGRTSAALLTKNAKYIYNEFETAGIEIIKASLVDREAYRNILFFGGSVNTLEAKTNREKDSIDKAAANAKELAEEVKKKLQSVIKKQVEKGAA